MPRDKARVFANTREMLDMARAGLADAIGNEPRRRRPGLANLFTYGRSVTLAMQTIKSIEPGFADWWKPYQDEMAADPLMRFFNNARTELLHEGEMQTSQRTTVGATQPVDLGAIVQQMAPLAPPHTTGTFFFDPVGASGWNVEMPDGSKEKVYFDLPDGLDIVSTMRLPSAPDKHAGQAIADKSVGNIGALYLQRLEQIVADFEARFDS